MDIWSRYRSAVKEVLPKAMVVVDKFHVAKIANDELDSIRKQITRIGPYKLKKNCSVFLRRESKLTEKRRATRDEWFTAYPKLKVAYDHSFACMTAPIALQQKNIIMIGREAFRQSFPDFA